MLESKDKKIGITSDPLFNTKDNNLSDLWDIVQRCQVDFAFNQELAIYFSWREWGKVHSVLDLGTGNGYYLSKLASFFQEKEYHGIDLSEELIAIANTRYSNSNIKFSSQDLFNVNGSYDFIIMRLLLQHLKDVKSVLNRVEEMLNPGGSAVIIDSWDSMRVFHPEVPEFRRFFSEYTSQQAGLELDRSFANDLAPKINTSESWHIGDKVQMLLPSTIPGNLKLFQKYYNLMIEIVEKAGLFQYNFEAVKTEWSNWCSLNEVYTQVGLRIFRIDKT